MFCETVARGACHHCGESVAVKINRSRRAYYRCDSCGLKVEHMSQRTSDKWLQSLGAEAKSADDAGDDPKPPKRGEKPRRGVLESLFGGDE